MTPTPGVLDQIFAIFLVYGLIGVVALLLLFAVISLYKRNQTISDALQGMGERSIAANAATTAALEKLSVSQQSTAAALTRLADLQAMRGSRVR